LPVSDDPRSSEALQFLQKVLQSPGFVHSQRLSRFLRFVVETRLSGDLDRLKESIIGMEVFDRPAGYDPKLDAIVRVEAHRLRSKLLEYYSTGGAGDALRFVFSKGSYIPEFERREVEPAAPAAVTPSATLDSHPQRSRRTVLWLLAAVPLLLGAGVLITSRIPPAERPLPRFFTTFPGSETRPAFSPDGQSIAYVWSGGESEGIYVQRIDSDAPVRITHSRFDETVPAWSPDGRHVAFLRRDAANRLDVVVAAAVGGSERKVADEAADFTTYLGLSWSPDGRYLITSDRETPQGVRRIARFDVATGARTWLTAPPSNIPGDTLPAVSPDGQHVIFRRAFDEGVHDLFLAPIQHGAGALSDPRRVTEIQRGITGAAWTADGKSLVFGAKLNGSSDGLWRVPVSGGPVQPIAEAGLGALWPAVAPRGAYLAWCRGVNDVNIIQLRLDRDNATRPLIASTLVDTSPQFSPDGSLIAFRSTRTGSHEIWIADSNGTYSVRLTDIKGPLAGSPRWSPDGSTIAFDSRQSGSSDIYLLPVRGGSARRLTDSEANESVPSWSRDGRFVYFASDRSGRFEVWKQPAGGGAAQQITRTGGFTAFESPDGRYVYFSKGPASDGLWRVPVGGGAEKPVLPNLSRRMWGNWVVVEKGIYFIDYDDPEDVRSAWLRYYSLESRTSKKISKLANPPAAWDNGLAVSPDGKTVLYSQVDRYGYDIMLLPNFR
jgi:Tol biopolymer transport system component